MEAQFLTTTVPQPPNDPTSWLLNARVGWRIASPELQEAGVAARPDDDSLALAPLPESLRQLTEPSGSFGGLLPPANVTFGPDGSIYLMDAATLTLKRFNPCTCEFNPVPCFGGEGREARQLRNPHGIGICSGNLFVCDTGLLTSASKSSGNIEAAEDFSRENHRLSVFSLHGFVLRGHWVPPAEAYAQPNPTLANIWAPYDLAFDDRGRIYVTDPAKGCINRFTPGGKWELLLSGLGRVTFIAIDCQDRMYLVIEGIETRVRVFSLTGEDLTVRTVGLADLAVRPLLEAVELLSATEGIAQASLHGDRAHVIVRPGQWTAKRLTKNLSDKGISVESVEEVESSLEDVFTLLAHS